MSRRDGLRHRRLLQASWPIELTSKKEHNMTPTHLEILRPWTCPWVVSVPQALQGIQPYALHRLLSSLFPTKHPRQTFGKLGEDRKMDGTTAPEGNNGAPAAGPPDGFAQVGAACSDNGVQWLRNAGALHPIEEHLGETWRAPHGFGSLRML